MALRHVLGARPWSECSDEEWSDEETDESWEVSECGYDKDCLYPSLTLEALKQIEDEKKAQLAIGKRKNLRLQKTRCIVMSSPGVTKWVNGDTEYLPDLHAKSEEFRFVSVYVEYRIQLSDQKSPLYESRDIMAEVDAVHLKAEAVSTETKVVQVARVEANTGTVLFYNAPAKCGRERNETDFQATCFVRLESWTGTLSSEGDRSAVEHTPNIKSGRSELMIKSPRRKR